MPSGLVVLTFAAALGSGLTAGVLFGFSTFVMPALERLPAAHGIAAMQSINVKAVNPAFMAALFGSGVVSLGLAVFALTQLGESWAPYLVAAAVIYLAGPVGLTAGYHQPRNPLDLALLARTYDQEAHAPLLGVRLQRILLAPLVFLARRRRQRQVAGSEEVSYA